VFLSVWHELPVTPASSVDWKTLLKLRADVALELERLRAAGDIGAPLDAELDIYCTSAQHAKLASLGEELRFLTITSAARLHAVASKAEVPAAATVAASAGSATATGPWIVAQRSTATKCVRCWHLRVDVGSNHTHPELCLRCVGNLEMPGEQRRYV
jgi:isoleucyl-tRNA synthetase